MRACLKNTRGWEREEKSLLERYFFFLSQNTLFRDLGKGWRGPMLPAVLHWTDLAGLPVLLRGEAIFLKRLKATNLRNPYICI